MAGRSRGAGCRTSDRLGHDRLRAGRAGAPPGQPVGSAAGGGGFRLVRARLRRDRRRPARLAGRAGAVPAPWPAGPAGADLSAGAGPGRVEGATVAVGYAAAVVTPVWGSWAGTVALAVCLVPGRERRMRRSALQATALFAAGAAAVALVRFAVPGPATAAATLLAYEALLCALAAGVLVGLVRWPWERAEVADLGVELGQARSAPLRDELARALGDPSPQGGYWRLESAAFVDAAGRPLAVPDPGSGRSATMVERDGQLVALLVHDPAVLGDPGLAGAVSSGAR